ncbi:MAG TPA: hypothetical protein VD962_00480 [Rubricoccaceae bacterium]|nr:hypothetical protein [Rubricoccaceae bacterium]
MRYVTVFTDTPPMADLARQALEAAGIPCAVGSYAEWRGGCEVTVPEEDAPRAREVLHASGVHPRMLFSESGFYEDGRHPRFHDPHPYRSIARASLVVGVPLAALGLYRWVQGGPVGALAFGLFFALMGYLLHRRAERP